MKNIAIEIGADSLAFVSIDGLYRAMGEVDAIAITHSFVMPVLQAITP